MKVAAVCILLLASFQYGSATLNELADFVPHAKIARQVGLWKAKRCTNVQLQAQCSTNSYVQDVLNAISNCGSDSKIYVSSVEGVCRKNPNNGDYCGSALLDVVDLVEAIPRACSSSSCSLLCRVQIRIVLNSAGCCARSNFAVNEVISPYLSKCNLSLPSACPASSLTIPSVSSGSCSIADIKNIVFGFRCRKRNIRPILNALKSRNCEDFVTTAKSDCSYRNGQYCYERVLQTETVTALSRASLVCISNSSCSSGCRTQIRSIDNKLGCCINTLNATYLPDTSHTLARYRTITSYSLWSACGVTPPGQCEVRFSSGIQEALLSVLMSI